MSEQHESTDEQTAPFIEPTPVKRTSMRGFASMDPAKQKEIASMGGKSGHAQGKAHRFTSEEAKAAGRKGGLARKAKKAIVAPAVDESTQGSTTGAAVDSGELPVANPVGTTEVLDAGIATTTTQG